MSRVSGEAVAVMKAKSNNKCTTQRSYHPLEVQLEVDVVHMFMYRDRNRLNAALLSASLTRKGNAEYVFNQ